MSKKMKILEDPFLGLDRISMSSGTFHRTLHVAAMETQGKFSYTVYSPDPQDFGEWEQQVSLSDTEIKQYLHNLNEFVKEMVTFASPNDDEWEGICSNLQGIGESLLRTVVPPHVIDMARGWNADSTLVISTNEQWIPWELMHDGETFWATKFRLVRCPRTNDRRKIPRGDRPSGFARNCHSVVNAVGGNIIPAAFAEKAAALFSLFSLNPPPTVLAQKPFAALKKAVEGADLIHLTCHGHLEPHMLQIYANRAVTQNLLFTTIKQLPLEPGCLVFANACSSDAPTLNLGKMQSFGWEFYRQGANAFVGTLGTIPTEQAIAFAEAVYKELFRKDKKITLSEAIATAKQAAQQERNLFWLLYCVYGNPDFTLTT